MPLNLLASMLGMNLVSLPFSENPLDFWLIFLIMLIISSLMIIYFKKQKWI
jgi:Mg2+ and Co2+ transporter CorA